MKEFARLKQVTDSVTLVEPEDRLWEQYWGGVYNRIERNIGWTLFSVAGILLAIYAGFKAIEDLVRDPAVGLLLKIGARTVTKMSGDKAMLLSTTDTICEKRIVRHLGMVRGNTIRARHIGRDIMAVLRNIVGGEITDYTKLMGEAREQAMDRMVEDAQRVGANRPGRAAGESEGRIAAEQYVR